jgi:hypothetical protein
VCVDEWNVLMIFDQAVDDLGIKTAEAWPSVLVYFRAKEARGACDLRFNLTPVFVEEADEPVPPSVEHVVCFLKCRCFYPSF